MKLKTIISNPLVYGAYYNDDFDLEFEYELEMNHDDYGIDIEFSKLKVKGEFYATVDVETKIAYSYEMDECFSDYETKEVLIDLSDYTVVCDSWADGNRFGLSFENTEIDVDFKTIKIK